MLFMVIYTWEPGKRDELITRRAEKKGNAFSEGVKKVGEWTDAGGGRGFLLIESNDIKACTTSAMVWNDLMNVESVPVIETIELFEAGKGKGSKK
jgi:hypothetical protein